MTENYNNFVKTTNSLKINHFELVSTLSGEDAQRIYLNEINTGSKNTDVSSNIAKTDTPNTCTSIPRKHKEISEKDLFICVQNDDIETLKLALENCPDKINYRDDFGWTLLMIACQANSVEVVQELLKQGAETHIRDKAGNSALSLILRNKNDRLANIFLNNYKANKDGIEDKPSISDTNIESNGGFFCNICNVKVELSLRDHLSSTIHNINLSKGKKIPPNYIIPQSNKGYQMMIKVGWDKESGLGPCGSGNKYPIKVTQKKDRKGLGHRNMVSEDEKQETSIKFKNRKAMSRDRVNNKKMEVNFRRQFY